MQFKNRVYRTKHGLWTPIGIAPRKANILAVLRGDHGQGMPELFLGLNTITVSGEVYYAIRATEGTPTPDFSNTTAGLRLGSSSATVTNSDTDVTTFITGAATAVDATYPKNSDNDADNTGSQSDVVSWRYQFSASSFSAAVKEGAIVDNDGTPTAALTHFTITEFSKTLSDTLKMFVNHEFSGS